MSYYKNLTEVVCRSFDITSVLGKDIVESVLALYRAQQRLTEQYLYDALLNISNNIRSLEDPIEKQRLLLCCREYFPISETTLASGTMFGTSQSIGNQGGNVGNADFYAPGNALNLWGWGNVKKGKKSKKHKYPLYRRTFAEAVEEESKIDGIIISEKYNISIKEIFDKNQIDYNITAEGNIALHDTDDNINIYIEHIQQVITEAPFLNGDVVVMLGEFDMSEFKTPKKSFDKYDQEQLKKGIKVEREHTDNIEIARTIAANHLDEDPEYYIKLAKLHL